MKGRKERGITECLVGEKRKGTNELTKRTKERTKEEMKEQRTKVERQERRRL